MPCIFQTSASCLDVVDADAHVAKPFSGIRIAIVDAEGRIGFGAIVVRELEDAFAIRPVIL